MLWPIAIPALPALVFLCMVGLPRRLRNRILWLPLTAIVGSFILSVAAFASVWNGTVAAEGGKAAAPGAHAAAVQVAQAAAAPGAHAAVQVAQAAAAPGAHAAAVQGWNFSWPLATLAGRPLDLGLQLDPMAAVLLVTVTFVAVCVQVYSLGYMKGEQREGWYYAVLSLFTAAMLTLVLADTLLLVFAMWELMGLCSYLLIGFWYEEEAPRRASQKAFLTTRVGDIGFLIALFVIYNATGTWELSAVLSSVESWAPGVATAAAVGLLLAAMGKSAQVPLHVWLPDAMAGPTPASALIHAATMVAAGVYLVARTLPIFEAAPEVLQATLIIGSITALLGGTLAAVQHDVKKVLAYSTISQLGLMFMALGAASVVAALFHLVTHAFFKSLLFLGAGVIIHAAHTQDMREMGGLRRYLPVTCAAFLVGSLALAGVVPLSGFFSKDEIVAALLRSGQYWAVGVLLVTSALTAFYMTRLYFRVFEGPAQNEQLTEGPPSMVGPIVALALVTVVIGFGSTSFAAFLGHEGEWPTIELIAVSTGVAFFGIANGWWAYGRSTVVKNTAIYKRRLGPIYGVFVQKLFFDTFYEYVFIRPYMEIAGLLAGFDRSAIDGVVNAVARAWVTVAGVARTFDGAVIDGAVDGAGRAWVATTSAARRFDSVVIDGLVDGVATLSRRAGRDLRHLQTGHLQTYQRLVLSAVVLLMLYLMLSVVLKGA